MAPLVMKASGTLRQMQWLLSSSLLSGGSCRDALIQATGVHSQVQTVRVVGGLWWLRGLPRPTADGLLRCCGLHRALHRGHGISLPLRPFFSSRCLQLPLRCPSPPWSGWDETAPQAELGEAWEGGSSLCFTFLPVWPVEPSGEGDPLGAELCHPGGQDDAGERKTFFLPVLCGSFLYFSFTVLL